MTRILPAGLIMLLACLASATAQDTPENTAQRRRKDTLDLDFRGGTVQQLIDMIEAKLGDRPNAVIHPDCANLAVPSIRLRAVEVHEIFEVLQALNPEIKVIHTSPNVFVLRHTPSKYRPMVQLRFVRPFLIECFLTKYKVEDIVTAVQTSWDLLSAYRVGLTAPSAKFHVETKLLIIAGTEIEVQAVEDIIRELGKELPPKKRNSTTGGKKK